MLPIGTGLQLVMAMRCIGVPRVPEFAQWLTLLDFIVKLDQQGTG